MRHQPGSAVRRSLIGRALRQYREALAYNLHDATVILGCDRSKISRVETGERGINGDELLQLLDAYGVPEEQQDVLLAISESTRGDLDSWWQDYVTILSGARLEYLTTEPIAPRILTYGPIAIPELLQTEGYARAAALAFPDETAAACRARQAEVLDTTTVSLEVVIGEAVLHQLVGDTAVMREQLEFLAQTADAAWTTLRVLPCTGGVPAAGGAGSFSVLRFMAGSPLGLVYLDGPRDGVCLEEPDDVAAYAEAFARMQAAAFSSADSLDLIRQLAEEYQA